MINLLKKEKVLGDFVIWGGYTEIVGRVPKVDMSNIPVNRCGDVWWIRVVTRVRQESVKGTC